MHTPSHTHATPGPGEHESGQSLVLFAAGLIVFLGLVAMSVDVGRLVWARTQVQAAVDAAALAAAQSLPDKLEAEAQASAFWEDNAPFLNEQGDNVNFDVAFDTHSKVVTVTGEADVPTIFARIFGINSWHVSADGDAESIAIDAMLVLDRSGSMCWDNYGPSGNYVGRVRLRNSINSSATSFQVTKDIGGVPISTYMYVGQVFRLESGATTEYLRVTAMSDLAAPYAQLTVVRNVANPNGGGASGAASHSAGRRVQGSTCQQAGAAPYYPWEYVKSGAQVFVDQFNPEYDRIGYTQFATRGTLEAPMTFGFTGLNAQIASSPDPTAGGSSDQYTNISHGFYMGNNQLIVNGRDNAKLVLVLLSDGVANRYCTPTTYTTTCPSTGTNSGTAYSRSIEQANYAADHGITVYTISYGNASDDALMQEIADITGGKFFKAPDAATLQAAFISISKDTHIRLSR